MLLLSAIYTAAVYYERGPAAVLLLSVVGAECHVELRAILAAPFLILVVVARATGAPDHQPCVSPDHRIGIRD